MSARDEARWALVVEDHAETRQWWAEALPEIFEGTRVQGAVTLQEGRDHLARRRYWLALVDINLPDGSGLDLVSDLAQRWPDTLCVVCTIFDDDHHIFSALRRGAHGYLVKDQPRERQLAQLREILHGQPPLSPGVARRILRFVAGEGGRDLPASRPAPQQEEEAIHLTDRERQILQLIAKGYSRPEVAELLGLSLNTVSTYTKNVYQKLNVTRRAEAVLEAMRLGLVSPEGG